MDIDEKAGEKESIEPKKEKDLFRIIIDFFRRLFGR